MGGMLGGAINGYLDEGLWGSLDLAAAYELPRASFGLGTSLTLEGVSLSFSGAFVADNFELGAGVGTALPSPVPNVFFGLAGGFRFGEADDAVRVGVDGSLDFALVGGAEEDEVEEGDPATRYCPEGTFSNDQGDGGCLTRFPGKTSLPEEGNVGAGFSAVPTMEIALTDADDVNATLVIKVGAAVTCVPEVTVTGVGGLGVEVTF